MTVQGINWLVQAAGRIVDRFGGVLTVLANVIISFTVFKALTTELTPIVTGLFTAVGMLTGKYISVAAAAHSAEIAQRGFNSALDANPYVLVAGAIAGAIAIWNVVDSIKAVNAAANIANDIAVGGYTQKEREFAARKFWTLTRMRLNGLRQKEIK